VEPDTFIFANICAYLWLIARADHDFIGCRNADGSRDKSRQPRVRLFFRFDAIVETGLLEVRTVRPRAPVWIVIATLLIAILERTIRTRTTFLTLAVLSFTLGLLCLRRVEITLHIGLLPASAKRLRLALERRGRARRLALERRSKAVGHAAIIIVIFLSVSFASRPNISDLSLLLRLLGRCYDAVVMLSVLEIAFSHNRIAGGLRIAGELQIFFRNVMGRAANFHVGSIGFKGPGERIGALAIAVIIAATHTLVLTRSHR
jgi:hypothetical protein